MQAPALEYLCTIVAEVAPPLPIEGRSEGESLTIIPIVGGTVTGRINGTVEAGGADWCRYRNDGALEVEARYWIRTDDGAIIDIVNVGRIAPAEAAARAADPYAIGAFLTTPQFRTAAAEYQWLTQRVFVGPAEAGETATTITVYAVVA